MVWISSQSDVALCLFFDEESVKTSQHECLFMLIYSVLQKPVYVTAFYLQWKSLALRLSS